MHPVAGRIARLLQRGGFLEPLLSARIGELQAEVVERPLQVSVDFARSPQANLEVGWHWDSQAAEVTLARWPGAGSTLCLMRVKPVDLAKLCAEPPTAGCWFCSCGAFNIEENLVCGSCIGGPAPPRRVALPFPSPWGVSQNICACGSKQRCEGPCWNCGGSTEKLCGHCSKRVAKSCDTVSGTWHCEECCETFRRFNESMKMELPEQWFVPGGQRWAWIVDERDQNHWLEFQKSGTMRSSFGDGRWWAEGDALETWFGRPHGHWRFTRTSEGFSALPLGNDLRREPSSALRAALDQWKGRIQGRPLYGAASPITSSMSACRVEAMTATTLAHANPESCKRQRCC